VRGSYIGGGTEDGTGDVIDPGARRTNVLKNRITRWSDGLDKISCSTFASHAN